MSEYSEINTKFLEDYAKDLPLINNIIEKGCNHKKKAFILANKSKQKYKYGHSKTKKMSFRH